MPAVPRAWPRERNAFHPGKNGAFACPLVPKLAWPQADDAIATARNQHAFGLGGERHEFPPIVTPLAVVDPAIGAEPAREFGVGKEQTFLLQYEAAGILPAQLRCAAPRVVLLASLASGHRLEEARAGHRQGTIALDRIEPELENMPTDAEADCDMTGVGRPKGAKGMGGAVKNMLGHDAVERGQFAVRGL